MGNLLKCLFVFIIVICVTGCAEQRIVEELGFIHSVAYELNEERDSEEAGVLVMTVALPQITPTAKEDREVLTTIGHTSKEAKARLSRKTDRILVSGQLRTALFSMNLAEKGIHDTMDTLKRDNAIGLNVKIITINGSGKELLLEDFPKHPRTSRYIYDLIEKEAKTNTTVDTTLHYFTRDYYDDGIDPITPIIKMGEGEIIIDGIALYRHDQMAMTVNPKDSRIFKMLHGDYVGGDLTFEMELEQEEKEDYLFISFTTLESKRKIKPLSPTKIQIEVEVQDAIEEYTGYLSLANDDVQREIENKLAKKIRTISNTLIEEMQTNRTDALGVGQYVRNNLSYQEWLNLNWREVYPTAEIDVQVNVKLKGFGSVK
ncbi:Ger(x)C family spore germination protein [Bacillus sp. FJAT-45350]|uniref:Ger(x)C family spore germination protein n=1 Tax=Bacillus sp. FJAT-45350 TaxID=2011014 RepID=UPI000BB833CB|nr:Ger(x)C family spore germination protein [Bacillus sp. FJAT-45350]